MSEAIVEQAIARWRALDDRAEELRSAYMRKHELVQDAKALIGCHKITVQQAERAPDRAAGQKAAQAALAEIQMLEGEIARLRHEMAGLDARMQLAGRLAHNAKAELERRGLLPKPIPSSAPTRGHREEVSPRAGFLSRLAGGQG